MTRAALYRSERHYALDNEAPPDTPRKPEPPRSMWDVEHQHRWLPWAYVATMLGTLLACHLIARFS